MCLRRVAAITAAAGAVMPAAASARRLGECGPRGDHIVNHDQPIAPTVRSCPAVRRSGRAEGPGQVRSPSRSAEFGLVGGLPRGAEQGRGPRGDPRGAQTRGRRSGETLDRVVTASAQSGSARGDGHQDQLAPNPGSATVGAREAVGVALPLLARGADRGGQRVAERPGQGQPAAFLECDDRGPDRPVVRRNGPHRWKASRGR